MSHPGGALSAYLDGELSRTEEHEVVAHLEGCAACRGELAELDAARTAVRALPVLEPAVRLEVPAPAARRRARRPVAWVAAAAAAVVLLAGGIGLVRDGGTDPPVDIVDMINQHNLRVGLDPGMPSVQVVQVGFP